MALNNTQKEEQNILDNKISIKRKQNKIFVICFSITFAIFVIFIIIGILHSSLVNNNLINYEKIFPEVLKIYARSDDTSILVNKIKHDVLELGGSIESSTTEGCAKYSNEYEYRIKAPKQYLVSLHSLNHIREPIYVDWYKNTESYDYIKENYITVDLCVGVSYFSNLFKKYLAGIFFWLFVQSLILFAIMLVIDSKYNNLKRNRFVVN